MRGARDENRASDGLDEDMGDGPMPEKLMPGASLKSGEIASTARPSGNSGRRQRVMERRLSSSSRGVAFNVSGCQSFCAAEPRQLERCSRVGCGGCAECPAVALRQFESWLAEAEKVAQCVDSATWRRRGTIWDCEYVAERPSTRCRARDSDGVAASEACVATCGKCTPSSGSDGGSYRSSRSAPRSMSNRPWCYAPHKDIVVPPFVEAAKGRSPALHKKGVPKARRKRRSARRAPPSPPPPQVPPPPPPPFPPSPPPPPPRADDVWDHELVFAGGIWGWKNTGPHAVSRYSLGIRQQLWLRYGSKSAENATGILISNATIPHDVWTRAKFCLAPAGNGWGIRIGISAILNCVPLVAQPNVVQGFEDVLPFDAFSRTIGEGDIAALPQASRSASRAGPGNTHSHCSTLATDVSLGFAQRLGGRDCVEASGPRGGAWRLSVARRVSGRHTRPRLQLHPPRALPPGDGAARPPQGRPARVVRWPRRRAAARRRPPPLPVLVPSGAAQRDGAADQRAAPRERGAGAAGWPFAWSLPPGPTVIRLSVVF